VVAYSAGRGWPPGISTLAESEVVDRIYEAAIVPELWPQTLHAFATSVGGVGSALYVPDPAGMRSALSPDIVAMSEAFLTDRMYENNRRVAAVLARRHPGFLREIDIYSRAECDADPLHRWLQGWGLGWGAGTAVHATTGETLMLTIERAYRKGPLTDDEVGQADALRPHLARAATVSAQLHLERARAAVATLEAIGVPAAVLRSRGAVMAANDRLRELSPPLVWRAGDRIAFRASAASRIYEAALAGGPERPSRPVWSFAVPAIGEASAMAAHLLPIRRAANDIFAGATWLLIAIPVTRPAAPDAGLLQSLFDLTPTEAEVARALTAGGTVEEIGRRRGVGYQTVRSQLNAVLAKTGAARQADLVALLAGLASPGP